MALNMGHSMPYFQINTILCSVTNCRITKLVKHPAGYFPFHVKTIVYIWYAGKGLTIGKLLFSVTLGTFKCKPMKYCMRVRCGKKNTLIYTIHSLQYVQNRSFSHTLKWFDGSFYHRTRYNTMACSTLISLKVNRVWTELLCVNRVT
jgi:hypothetical protein